METVHQYQSWPTRRHPKTSSEVELMETNWTSSQKGWGSSKTSSEVELMETFTRGRKTSVNTMNLKLPRKLN